MKHKTLIAAAVLCAGVAVLAVAKSPKGGAAPEPSIGSPAPDFTLTDTRGQKRSLADFKGKYVVLEWVNLGCPFVKKHYDSGNMQATQNKAAAKGVVWLSVCSSAEKLQGNMAPDAWNKEISRRKIASAAVLLDGDGTVGRAYGAKTTPHMFVINPKGVLIYKGAIDDKPSTDQADIPGAKNYVLAALDESMAGRPVSTSATPSYGCSVKYQ
jgi:hypothetical protein